MDSETWGYILLAIVINAPWIYVFIRVVFIEPGKATRARDKALYELKKERDKWDKEHPDRTRILCMDCHYCKTNRGTRCPATRDQWFDNHLYPKYCTYFKDFNVPLPENKHLSCWLATPPDGCHEPRDVQKRP